MLKRLFAGLGGGEETEQVVERTVLQEQNDEVIDSWHLELL